MILTSTVVQSKQFYWYLPSKRHECNFSWPGYIGVEIWKYLPKWKNCSVSSVGPVSVGMTNNQAILAVENINVYFLSKLYVHQSLTWEYCPLQSFRNPGDERLHAFTSTETGGKYTANHSLTLKTAPNTCSIYWHFTSGSKSATEPGRSSLGWGSVVFP